MSDLKCSCCGGFVGSDVPLTQRIEDLEEALGRILQWSKAYPTSVFPEVIALDYARAQAVLKTIGLSVDRISADALRHGLHGVGRIAEGALAAT